jgi:4-coumarate--CoA ligase
LLNDAQSDLGAYVDAITGQRINYRDVKEKATLLSTALIEKYELKPGDTVSIFSTNTIFYPIAMWAISRAGAFSFSVLVDI